MSLSQSEMSDESIDERVTRLLGEAHAYAQDGDLEAALDHAAVAYEDYYGAAVDPPLRGQSE